MNSVPNGLTIVSPHRTITIFKMGQPRPLFHLISAFSSSHSTIWLWKIDRQFTRGLDLNPQLLVNDSLPLTTWPVLNLVYLINPFVFSDLFPAVSVKFSARLSHIKNKIPLFFLSTFYLVIYLPTCQSTNLSITISIWQSNDLFFYSSIYLICRLSVILSLSIAI